LDITKHFFRVSNKGKVAGCNCALLFTFLVNKSEVAQDVPK
jgi:hypothetical protein